MDSYFTHNFVITNLLYLDIGLTEDWQNEMSCFDGLMEEYRCISLDRFDGINLKSSAFFLSHFHSDHIVGLPEPEFMTLLETRLDVYLYTSEVTKSLLLADKRFEKLEKHIISLPLEESTVINIIHDGKPSAVAVTLISAGHCPGSVMFFFEGDDGNVLYTGDFRLPKGSAARIRPFHMYNKTKKPIKSIYVDTTFCSSNAIFIPKREDCVTALVTLVKQWLVDDKQNAIRLDLSARYGYEFLLLALNKALNCKIYCPRKYLYRSVPQIYHILTDKNEFTKIFAGFKTDKYELDSRPLHFRRIILSTYYFTERALPDQVYERISENTYRFCFSFHSSYSEVCDFVKYINPDNVYANVIPFCKTPLETVATNLALKCGLKTNKLNKASAESTAIRSTDDAGDLEKLGSAPCFNHGLKRALPFNDDNDDDTQGYCDRIISKVQNSDKVTANKCDNIRCELTVRNDISKTQTRFMVPSSTNCKAPTESEIDELHIKLALSGDW